MSHPSFLRDSLKAGNVRAREAPGISVAMPQRRHHAAPLPRNTRHLGAWYGAWGSAVQPVRSPLTPSFPPPRIWPCDAGASDRGSPNASASACTAKALLPWWLYLLPSPAKRPQRCPKPETTARAPGSCMAPAPTLQRRRQLLTRYSAPELTGRPARWRGSAQAVAQVLLQFGRGLCLGAGACSEDDRVQHGAHALADVGRHDGRHLRAGGIPARPQGREGHK
jgi:hypothetical protein